MTFAVNISILVFLTRQQDGNKLCKKWQPAGNPADCHQNSRQEATMIVFTGEVKNEQGKIEEKKFEVDNPELKQWLDDVGEGLSGIAFADE